MAVLTVRENLEQKIKHEDTCAFYSFKDPEKSSKDFALRYLFPR